MKLKWKEVKKLCLNVNGLRALAQVNKIDLKLKEMKKLSKIRKDERNGREERKRNGFKKS